MKIEIVKKTNYAYYEKCQNQGKMQHHISKIIWNLSRPAENISDIDISTILNLDLPVNEFPTAILFIESTILEREIIASMRNHVMWAQTSRVQNILEFEYPYWADKPYCEEQRQRMKKMAIFCNQDQYRQMLPLLSLTKYSIAISARDLIKLRNFAVEKIIDEDYAHLQIMLNEMKYEIENVLRSLSFSNYENYKPLELLSITGIEAQNAIAIEGSAEITARIPIALRAQLVRHRNILFRDTLLELMRNQNIFITSLNDRIGIQITGLKEDLISILRKRSCWIAQYKLWEPILSQISKLYNMGEEGLPCHNGKCPYNKDAELRYTEIDPNPPCPIHAKMNNKSVSYDSMLDMMDLASSDRKESFWKNKIEDLRNQK